MYFLIHCCIYLNAIPPYLFKIHLLLIFNLVNCFVVLLQTILTLVSFCITSNIQSTLAFFEGHIPKPNEKRESGVNWPPPQNNVLVLLSVFLYNNTYLFFFILKPLLVIYLRNNQNYEDSNLLFTHF